MESGCKKTHSGRVVALIPEFRQATAQPLAILYQRQSTRRGRKKKQLLEDVRAGEQFPQPEGAVLTDRGRLIKRSGRVPALVDPDQIRVPRIQPLGPGPAVPQLLLRSQNA